MVMVMGKAGLMVSIDGLFVQMGAQGLSAGLINGRGVGVGDGLGPSNSTVLKPASLPPSVL